MARLDPWVSPPFGGQKTPRKFCAPLRGYWIVAPSIRFEAAQQTRQESIVYKSIAGAWAWWGYVVRHSVECPVAGPVLWRHEM